MSQRNFLYLYLFFLFFIIVLITSCRKDKAELSKPANLTPSCGAKYSDDIKPIIAAKCALSGCHVTKFSFGDFTLYADLKTRVDNGKINSLVIENKLMPPANSDLLTETELNKIKCWISYGAPEN
jgi:uncharacterized membrane protein